MWWGWGGGWKMDGSWWRQGFTTPGWQDQTEKTQDNYRKNGIFAKSENQEYFLVLAQAHR